MSIADAAEFRIALTTAATIEDAERMALSLVEQRLAACVHLGAVQSVYRWRGATEQANEIQLWIKTSAKKLGRLEEVLRELHSYELPELLVLAPESGSAAYLDWLRDSLGE